MISLHGSQTRPVFRLAFSPDGTRLAAGHTDNAIVVWHLPDRSSTLLPTVPDTPTANATPWFTPDGKRLVCGRGDGGFMVFNSHLKRIRGLSGLPDTGSRYALGFGGSPDGSRLLVANSDNTGCTVRLILQPWGRNPKTLWNTGHVPDVWSLGFAFHGDGPFVAIERRSRRYGEYVTLRDPATNALKAQRFLGHLSHRSFDVNGDGLIAVANGPRVFVWNGQKRGGSATYPDPTGANVQSLAFHRYRPLLFTACSDGAVRVYDTTTWQVNRTYDWNLGPLRSVTLSADCTLAAVGTDSGSVWVWDLDE